MTPEALQTLRDTLTAARQPVARTELYAFPRGWNEALDFVERKIKETIGEESVR
jgi:hypothetical protein